MTTKKPTQAPAKQSVAAAAPSQEEVLARYMDAVKSLELMRQQLEASGVKLEVPPTEPAVIRSSEPVITPEVIQAAKALPEVPLPAPEVLNQVKPGAAIGGTYRPWQRMDLKGQERFWLVPQFIPGAVHPVKDENGKYHIFMDVNGLQCSLLVWENQEVSGMFYHAYKNIEDSFKASEEYKVKGPVSGPHVAGGPGGSNTWYFQGEAPSAWINIDGGYYKPGDAMPNDEIPEARPS